MDIKKIWEEYRSGIKAFLHSKVSNPADVDDLLQDILIKTYKNIDTLKSEENFKTWIFKISRNTVIDFYRKNKEVQIETVSDIPALKQDQDTQQILSKCIKPFIDSLPKESKELLTAIDLNGESQKKYAEQNGINYSTLKSKVQKGRDQLKGIFENCCHFSLDPKGRLIDFEVKSNTCKKC